MEPAPRAAAEAPTPREIAKPSLLMHMQQKRPQEQGLPAPSTHAQSGYTQQSGPTVSLPKLQPSPSPVSGPKRPTCPLQSLRVRMGPLSGTQKLRSCLRIAPAGTMESEQAAHLLASIKQKDEEALKKEKRKMRNRLAAAKSNERRREKLEAQKKELEDLKERLHSLKSKQMVVEQENEKLKTCLRQKRNEGDGTSDSAMSDPSQSK